MNLLLIVAGIEGDDHFLAAMGVDPAKPLPDEDILEEALLLQETLGVDLDQVSFKSCKAY